MGDGVCDTLEHEETYPKLTTFEKVPIGEVFFPADALPLVWKKIDEHRGICLTNNDGRSQYFPKNTRVNLIIGEI